MRNNNLNHRNKLLELSLSSAKGFSLIEVLIFVSILAVFFVTAAAVATASLRDIKVNEHKILATRYSDQVVEWLRGEKEIDWQLFYGRTGGGVVNYCFNNSDIDWPDNPGTCTSGLYNSLTPPIYSRTVTLDGSTDVNQVNVSVKTEWQEFGRTYNVTDNTIFTIAE